MSQEMAVTRSMEMWTEPRGALHGELEVVGKLKPERVQEWLEANPGWSLDSTGKTLLRVRSFPSAEVAAQYGAFVTALAGALGLPVRVSIADGQATLSLRAGREHRCSVPLTEAVLAFGAQLG
jgi:hypothetical protein